MTADEIRRAFVKEACILLPSFWDASEGSNTRILLEAQGAALGKTLKLFEAYLKRTKLK